MKLQFDLDAVRLTEFGIGRDNAHARAFVQITADSNVQSALQDMARATWLAMTNERDNPELYNPAEKHGNVEYLYLPISDDLCLALKNLHNASNLDPDSKALADPANVFCYFVRFADDKNRHLTALRRATQFKGVLKSRLLQVTSDALKLIADKVFKLDNDFDLLIDSENVFILRPSGFEFIGQLQSAVLGAVPRNIKAIQQEIAFVDFRGIEAYASNHPRAARYLASIRGAESKNLNKRALKSLCKKTGVTIKEAGGKIVVGDSNIMGFLEVLDRRRYEIELVQDAPERYRAPSRQKLISKPSANGT